uniref:Uncharacterized protein n=1 Tax=Arundo donax TaxID=35708 RepID=A0A0A9DQ31_ARUDO
MAVPSIYSSQVQPNSRIWNHILERTKLLPSLCFWFINDDDLLILSVRLSNWGQ